MHFFRAWAGLLLAWSILPSLTANAQPLQRVANTTLQLPANPASFGYRVTNAFTPSITFLDPLAIASPPGETNRLFVVEQGGRIAVVTNLAVPNRSVFLDISGEILGGVPSDERGLLSLAFHPGFSTNGYFFVWYTGLATTPVPGGTNAMHDILARFQVSPANSNVALAASEVRLILQYDEAGNHNAGDLHFGPDGYLYLTLGDEGNANDSFNNSQRIDKDFFSGMLRLDVDKRPGNLAPNPHPSVTTNYAVPSDNPFVGATQFNGSPVNPAQVRTEFWAVGLRNPWRFSIDAETGFIYCGDVGQDAWEEVDIIKKGGNYGWAFREGLHAGPKAPPISSTRTEPIQEYGHGTGALQGNSITGGAVYRGKQLSQLYGSYVFGDYVSGNIWALTYDGTNTVPFVRLTNETTVAAFGADPRNGDILMANQTLDTLRRLVYSTNFSGTLPPATLDLTGAFLNTAALTPQAGVVPYDVNVPYWTDNAIKTLWFSIPDTNLTINFDREANWSFPTGTVWIQHFDLELTNGVPASRKRLETRFLVKNAGGVYGLTYRWGNSTANASLVAEEGLDESFAVDTGGGVVRTQTWHYPGRSECLRCHTPQAGYALGFNTAQLNRDASYGSLTTNQIAALTAAHYFSASSIPVHTLRSLAAVSNNAVSLEYRVRSYLAANCAHCHQPAGPGGGFWDARISTTTAASGIVDGPLVNTFGNAANRVAKPGSLANSMLLTRMTATSSSRMPPMDSTTADNAAALIVCSWITNDLPGWQTFADWQIAHFGSTNAPAAAPGADPDGDSASNGLEYMTGTDPLQATSYWKLGIQPSGNTFTLSFPQRANRAYEVQCATNLVSPLSWSPLDVAGNEPLFSISNKAGVVTDTAATNKAKLYRVRVYPP